MPITATWSSELQCLQASLLSSLSLLSSFLLLTGESEYKQEYNIMHIMHVCHNICDEGVNILVNESVQNDLCFIFVFSQKKNKDKKDADVMLKPEDGAVYMASKAETNIDLGMGHTASEGEATEHYRKLDDRWE